MPEVKTALPGYYTTKEAAERLGYADRASLNLLCISGKINAIKVERMWFIPASEVEEFAKREVAAQGNRGVKRK